jgi:hypothetical protein
MPDFSVCVAPRSQDAFAGYGLALIGEARASRHTIPSAISGWSMTTIPNSPAGNDLDYF